MSKLLFTALLVALSYFAGLSQTKSPGANARDMKQVSLSFLKWYKQTNGHLSPSPILKGFNADTLEKDSLVRIDLPSLESYLNSFRQSGYVSDAFVDHLKRVYSNVSDSLKAHPLKDYFGPVPGLEADVLFGFGAEEVFTGINSAQVKKVNQINGKGLLKLKISSYVALVFTLSKHRKKWLIDSVKLDASSQRSIANQ